MISLWCSNLDPLIMEKRIREEKVRQGVTSPADLFSIRAEIRKGMREENSNKLQDLYDSLSSKDMNKDGILIVVSKKDSYNQGIKCEVVSETIGEALFIEPKDNLEITYYLSGIENGYDIKCMTFDRESNTVTDYLYREIDEDVSNDELDMAIRDIELGSKDMYKILDSYTRPLGNEVIKKLNISKDTLNQEKGR